MAVGKVPFVILNGEKTTYESVSSKIPLRWPVKTTLETNRIISLPPQMFPGEVNIS